MKLPDYNICTEKLIDRKANPIEQFIAQNEPAGKRSEEVFRRTLLEMIKYTAKSNTAEIVAFLREKGISWSRDFCADKIEQKFGKE